jgi:TonB-dependent starch-binding outer membrane protein SusC
MLNALCSCTHIHWGAGFTKTLRIMRITVLLLFIACMQVSARGVSQNITLSLKNVSLEKVFNEIKNQTGYSFLIDQRDIRKTNPVNVDIKDAPLAEVLDACLKNQHLNYKIIGELIVITSMNIVSPVQIPPSTALNISGRITNEKNEPLEGVTVVVKGTATGTNTNDKGLFTLENIEGDAVLLISMVDYQSQEISVAKRTNIQIILKSSLKDLDEVVVVGYGTQKKVNLTGAVETVDVEGMATRPLSNASIALQGKVAGAFISQNSGQPGYDNASILIRGVGTFNNTAPLVMIDGMEGSLNDVNPKDIASISVLKDASSSAIYGNRAANGVILITTKRGRQDKMNVEYTGYYGVQKVTSMPEVLKGLDYLELSAKAYYNINGRNPTWYTDEYMDNFRNNVDPIVYPLDFDWGDFLLRPARMHDHYVSVSGGSKAFQYSASVGYLDQDGVAVGNNSKKLTFRSNLSSHFLKNKLHINILASGHEQSIDDLVDGMTSAFYFAYVAPPTVRMVIPGVGYSNYAYGYGAKAAGGINEIRNGPINLRGVVTINPFKGLDLNASYGIYKNFYEQKIFRPSVQLQSLNPDGTISLPTPSVSNLSYTRSESLTTIFNAYANYSLSIGGKHNFAVMAGMEARQFDNQGYEMSRSNLSVNIPQFGFGDPVTQKNNSNASGLSWLSQFGRFSYNYKGRYLFETNVRNDGSSRFQDKWGVFPSVSAGWRLSEEKFIKERFLWLSDFKIRASWGRLGNESIGQSYAASDELSLNLLYNFNNMLFPAGAVTKLANRSTSWETAEMTNFGIDFSFLDKRLSGTTDYFIKETYDILMQIPVSSTLGLTTVPYQNAGKMKNSGIELSVKYSDKIGKLGYAVGVMGSHVTNRVTDLAGRSPIIMGNLIWKEGSSYNSFFAYETEGIYQSQDEINKHLILTDKDGNTTNPYVGLVAAPGDIRFKDQVTVDADHDGIPESRDGIINEDDKVIIGKSYPDWTFSSTISADWKGIDINIFLQGVYGVNSLNQGYLTSPFHGGAANTGAWYKDAWTAEKPSQTIQRVYSDPSRYDIVSSYYMEDASYIRVKNIEIGYTVSNNIIRKTGLNPANTRVRIFANVQNAFTWTKMRFGFDPEKPSTIINSLQYPQVRIYSCGVNVKF